MQELDQQRFRIALSYVMNLLSRREYSEFEIRCKMQEKDFTQEEIEQTLQHCQERHWQSDARFCENYLRQRAQKGYGLRRIRQELLQLKGIKEETLEQVLLEDELEINWQNIALKTLRKKFPHFQEELSPKMKQKIWQYMFSHGFSHDDFSDFIGKNDEEIWDYFS